MEISLAELGLIIRKAVPNDLKYIISSWLKSNRAGVAPLSRKAGYYDVTKFCILTNAIKNGTQLVACEAKNPSSIIGWISGETDKKALIIHYIYVRSTDRELGIAKALIRELSGPQNYKTIYFVYTPQKWQRRLIKATRDVELAPNYLLYSTFTKEVDYDPTDG